MIHEDPRTKTSTPGIKSGLTGNDGISPFAQKPSFDDLLQEDEISEVKISKRIHAADLFSLFTADIIKEEVIFIR